MSEESKALGLVMGSGMEGSVCNCGGREPTLWQPVNCRRTNSVPEVS
jgi:hypothetical protein